jgi:hypothetical protein
LNHFVSLAPPNAETPFQFVESPELDWLRVELRVHADTIKRDAAAEKRF